MATTSPTPLPLSQRINTATRPLHTQLNALILSLLPLALPPHASDPKIYAGGLEHILSIYSTFESAFKLLLTRNLQRYREEPGKKRISLIDGLLNLQIPALERSQRLRMDCKCIFGREPRIGRTGPKLGGFVMHISAAIHERSHLLLAYTWILYMALFSGGRYIRRKLRQAGPGFWGAVRGEKGDFDRYLAFWTFEGEEDGDDVKADFKRRFGEVEVCLTEEEKEEVVAEAVLIMQSMLEVVPEIAETVGGEKATGQTLVLPNEQDQKHKGVGLRDGHDPGMHWLLFKHILPMGFAELIIGVSRAVTMGSGTLRGNLMGGEVGVKF